MPRKRKDPPAEPLDQKPSQEAQGKPADGAKKKYAYKTKSFRFDSKEYCCTGKTQKEADEKARKKREALEKGLREKDGKMRVRDWCLKWVEAYRKENVSGPVYDAYISRLENYVFPVVGGMRMHDVRGVDLQKALNKASGMSSSFVDKLDFTIKGPFKQAFMDRMIPFDPSMGLKKPKSTKGDVRALTADERRHFLGICDSHRSGLWILTLLYTGIRPGESAALRWKDVDFKKKQLSIVQALKRDGTLGDPKTKAGFRKIPVPDFLLGRLLEARGEPFDFVFKTKRGKPLYLDYFDHEWDNIVKIVDKSMGGREITGMGKEKVWIRAIAEDITLYSLRHSYCTWLQDIGIPVNVAAEYMGHDDVKTTLGIYTDNSERALGDAADRMNEDTRGMIGRMAPNMEGATSE
jgi:integrase